MFPQKSKISPPSMLVQSRSTAVSPDEQVVKLHDVQEVAWAPSANRPSQNGKSPVMTVNCTVIPSRPDV